MAGGFEKEGFSYYNYPKMWGGPDTNKNPEMRAYSDPRYGITNPLGRDRNPDGSPDARRESTWLGVAAKAALIAGMAAPFVGPAIRGGMAFGKGAQGAYAAGGMKGIGQTIAGAGRHQASRAADAGRAAMADPRAAMAAAGQGIAEGAGRLGRTYRDFYAGGGAGRELNRARDYFGL